MKITINDNGLIVVDEFLPQEIFNKITSHIECDSFELTNLGSDKFYLLNSGEIYKNKKKFFSSSKPWNIAYEDFMENLESFLSEHKIIFDKAIKDISLKVHIYKAGAEIHWHKDWMHNASYSFYAHTKWDYRWGGNLMIASEETQNSQTSGKRLLDLQDESAQLLEPGCGRYIAPKPNRLVIIPSNLYHKVERVDHSSGHNCRVSLTGFIYNE